MNVYLALLFRERPDGHMTLRYYTSAREEFQLAIRSVVKRWLGEQDPERFKVLFDVRDMFGRNRNIPVWRPSQSLPEWVCELRELVQPERKDQYGFEPHVTTADTEPMELTAYSVALMHRKAVIDAWRLRGN